MPATKEKQNLPSGWKLKKLSDVCDIVNGSTPSTSNNTYWNGEINWYTPNDLKHQKIVLDDSERKISDIGLQSIGSKVVPARSLILSTRAPIGYLGITKTKTSFNQGCKGLTPKDDKLSAKFLYYNLFHQKKALNDLGSGSTFLELSSNNLASFEVLLPPIKEQQKIADILGTVDEDIAKTQEVIEATEKLKRGLMQQLFTRGFIGGFMFDTNIFDKILDGKFDIKNVKGKIFVTHIQEDELSAIKDEKRKLDVEKIFISLDKTHIPTESAIWGVSKYDRAKYGSGDGLLDKLTNGNSKNNEDALIAETAIKNNLALVTEDKGLQKKVAQLGGKVISTHDFFAGNLRKFKETKIGQIPEGWEVKKIGDLGSVITGNTPKTSDRGNYGEEYLFVSPKDMGYTKYINNSESKLSKKGFDTTRKISIGSVLVVCIGSTIGKIAVAGIELSTNQQINSVVVNESYSNEFVYYQLLHRKQDIFGKRSTQAVPIINKTDFSEIPIALPKNKEEQKEIAEILSAVDEKILVNKKLKEKLIHLKKGLMQNLLSGKVRAINI